PRRRDLASDLSSLRSPSPLRPPRPGSCISGAEAGAPRMRPIPRGGGRGPVLLAPLHELLRPFHRVCQFDEIHLLIPSYGLPRLSALELADDLVEGDLANLRHEVRYEKLAPPESGLFVLRQQDVARDVQLSREMTDRDARAIGLRHDALDG